MTLDLIKLITKSKKSFFQQGVSIVELMVAMVLSLILTLGVSQIYLGSKQTYRLQEAQSRVQENGRYALNALTTDIRQAGYMGCPSSDIVPMVIANAPLGATGVTPNNAVTGYEGSETTWAPSPLSGWPAVPTGSVQPVAGTDIITVQFAQSCGAYLTSQVLGSTQNPTVSIAKNNSCSINASSTILVLADCNGIDVFRADTVTAGNTTTDPTVNITGTANNALNHFASSHGVDAEVKVFNSHTYFIALFNGEPTLYKRENSDGSSAQPLIEGVEDMQILYGVDMDPNDCSVDQYYKANDSYLSTDDNWAYVTAVRVDLLLRSTGDDGVQLSTMTTNPCTGVALTSTQLSDKRLRKCFSTTINLRNPRTKGTKRGSCHV